MTDDRVRRLSLNEIRAAAPVTVVDLDAPDPGLSIDPGTLEALCIDTEETDHA